MHTLVTGISVTKGLNCCCSVTLSVQQRCAVWILVCFFPLSIDFHPADTAFEWRLLL
jgi:hypothetical protein